MHKLNFRFSKEQLNMSINVVSISIKRLLCEANMKARHKRAKMFFEDSNLIFMLFDDNFG